MGKDSPTDAKIKTLRQKPKTTAVTTTGPGHVFSSFVSKVRVKPQQKLRLPLGSTLANNPPKGFSVGLSPYDEAEKLVDMRITTSGLPTRYEFMLHIANNGQETVSAEIWQM